jgi:hypothetical protein
MVISRFGSVSCTGVPGTTPACTTRRPCSGTSNHNGIAAIQSQVPFPMLSASARPRLHAPPTPIGLSGTAQTGLTARLDKL